MDLTAKQQDDGFWVGKSGSDKVSINILAETDVSNEDVLKYIDSIQSLKSDLSTINDQISPLVEKKNAIQQEIDRCTTIALNKKGTTTTDATVDLNYDKKTYTLSVPGKPDEGGDISVLKNTDIEKKIIEQIGTKK